jgi:hypothetical protein
VRYPAKRDATAAGYTPRSYNTAAHTPASVTAITEPADLRTAAIAKAITPLHAARSDQLPDLGWTHSEGRNSEVNDSDRVSQLTSPGSRPIVNANGSH